MKARSVTLPFLDPPFGANISYSDLNFIWESWLRVVTDNVPEAIESRGQNKNTEKYRDLMRLSFREAYRILGLRGFVWVMFGHFRLAVACK
jgi:predicted RNA methylase